MVARARQRSGQPSFPRKRESHGESIAGVWIPAFAGMTEPSLALALSCGRKAALHYPLTLGVSFVISDEAL